MNPLVSARDLSVSVDSHPLLTPVSFDVERGEALAVLGSNGSGKTTLLRLIGGRLQPTSGSITVGGIAPDEKSPAFRRMVAALLGNPPSARNLTLREHLSLVAVSWDADVESALRQSDELLDRFGIAQLASRYPHELSSGQAQLFALALTLSRSFDVLLLDEPEQRLDVDRLHLVGEIVRSLVAKGKTVVLASHSPALVDRVADRRLHVRETARGKLV